MYRRVVGLCLELIRQFYDAPRSFRTLGELGEGAFVSFDNAGLVAQSQGMAFGLDMGMRLPVFDIRIEAQRKNAYARLSQNELAVQFFQLGFFDPGRAEQALQCMQMMDFDGKEELMQRISAGAARFQAAQAAQAQAAQAAQAAQLTAPETAQMMAARQGAHVGS